MRPKFFNFVQYLCYVTFMSLELKQKREALNLDLQEISSILRVRRSFLAAIENEQYEAMPPDIYTRGYIKLYAKYLDCPYEQAIEPYENYLSVKFGKAKPVTAESDSTQPADEVKTEEIAPLKTVEAVPAEPEQQYTPPPAEKPTKPGGRRPVFMIAALLCVLALAFVFYKYVMTDNSRSDPGKRNTTARTSPKKHVTTEQNVKADTPSEEKAKTEPAPSAQTTEPAAAETKQAQNSEENQKAEPAPAPQTAVAEKVEEIKVPEIEYLDKLPSRYETRNIPTEKRRHIFVISAIEKTEARLLVDGKHYIKISLAPGESRTLNAFVSVSGVISDGGAAKLKFNGKTLPQGNKGESRSINLPGPNYTPRKIP